VGVIIRSYKGFISYPGGPIAYFKLIHTPENTLAQAGQVGAILVADLLSVYRVSKLGPERFRRLQISVLFVTFLNTFVCAILFIVYGWQAEQGVTFFDRKIFISTVSFLASSLFTTAMSTGLIAYSLWNSDRDMSITSEHRRSLPYRAMRIMIESAALYSSTNLLYLLLFASKSPVEASFSTLTSPLASITVSLITLRLKHSTSIDYPTPPSTHQDRGNSSMPAFRHTKSTLSVDGPVELEDF